MTRYQNEDPARLRKGPIGLQIHAGVSVVEYKDLEIEIAPREAVTIVACLLPAWRAARVNPLVAPRGD